MVLVLQFMPASPIASTGKRGPVYDCRLRPDARAGLILRGGCRSPRAARCFGLLLALLGFALGGSFFGPALGGLSSLP
jgi:hypothetical protein